jgi:hypothetical protein
VKLHRSPRRCTYVPISVCNLINDHMPEVAIHSPSVGAPDLRHASGTSSIVQVESLRLLPLMVTLCVLAGLCLMGTAWAIATAFRAQERTDLLQLEVESFKNVLHANKLPTAAHLPGELP